MMRQSEGNWRSHAPHLYVGIRRKDRNQEGEGTVCGQRGDHGLESHRHNLEAVLDTSEYANVVEKLSHR